MYAATMKDEGNAADGRFSTACKDVTPKFIPSPVHPFGVNDEMVFPEDALVKALRGISRSLRASLKFILPEPKSTRIL
jgi:hypothetical protein